MLRMISILFIITAIFAVGPITHASPPQNTPGTRLVCPAELGNTCFVFGGSYRPDYDRAKTKIEAQDAESYEWNFKKGCDHRILLYIQPGEMCYGIWEKAPPMPGTTAEALNERVRQVDYKICRNRVSSTLLTTEALDIFVDCLEMMQRLRADAMRPRVVIDYSL